jgi:hypothetical protein
MTFGIARVFNRGVIGQDGFAVAGDGSLSLARKRVTHPAVNASFTIGAEDTNVRNINIQLKDAFNNSVLEKVLYGLLIFDGTTDTLIATGGSTGITDRGVGAIFETITAKKKFVLISSETGLNELSWTDTANESVRLAVILPGGNLIISPAFANA